MSELYVPPAPDNTPLPVKKIALVFVGAVAIFSAACLVAWAMSLAHPPAARAPTILGKPQIGEVNQRPFSLEHSTGETKTSERERLAGYGWVSRDNDAIHVPIDLAIEEVVKARRKP